MSGRTVLRAADRFRTRSDGRDTWHTFSFGAHYDPGRVGCGPLVACNEERLEPGAGYATHAHRDVEIVTWVLAGWLHHDVGVPDHRGVSGSSRVGPGQVQRLGAGAGVEHAEHAGADGVRLLQLWVRPDRPGGPPQHEQADAAPALAAGGWVRLAGDGGLVGLGRSGAVLAAARLRPGDPLRVPAGDTRFLHVATGTVELAGVGRLAAGDAACWTAGSGSVAGTDGAAPVVLATVPAEVLVWTFAD